jgi:hypothetical protein
MKKRELQALIESLVQETLQEARPGASRHYRKSKMGQQLDKVEKVPTPRKSLFAPQTDPDEEKILSRLTQVLVTIDQYPPLNIPSPDPKDPKKQIMLPNKQQHAIVVQAAEKVLNHLPVSKKDLDTLARFILASNALPRLPLTVLIRGLVRIFNKPA